MIPESLFATAQNPLIGENELKYSLAKCLTKKLILVFSLAK